MVKKEIEEVKAKVGEKPEKGTIAPGRITKIEEGLATDFMSPEQIEKRRCSANDPYLEITIAVNGSETKHSFKNYAAIGDGIVSPNTDLGRLMAVTSVKLKSEVPMVAMEYEKNNRLMTVWNPVLG